MSSFDFPCLTPESIYVDRSSRDSADRGCCRYAQRHGLKIKCRPRNCKLLQFADGTYQMAVGQVQTTWTFESGLSIPVTFEVLQDCLHDVILGEEVIYENDVFGTHASSIQKIQPKEEIYNLAPFTFMNISQKKLRALAHYITSRRKGNEECPANE